MSRALSLALALLTVAALAGLAIAGREAVAVDDPARGPAELYLDAEHLLPALESFAGPASGTPTQAIARKQTTCYGVVWSSNAQAFFDNHTPGSRMTLRFEVPEAGTYDLSVVHTRAPDYGVIELAVDGQRIGDRLDGYAAAVERSAPTSLGPVALAEGSHTLTLTVPDKSAASSGYRAGLDFLRLRRAGS